MPKGIDAGSEKLRSGVSVIIFPEGTRSKNGKIGVFKNGAFVMAFDSKATIIPVRISGSYEVQPVGSWFIKPNVLKANFGLPITYDTYKNMSISQLSDLVKEKIGDLSSNS